MEIEDTTGLPEKISSLSLDGDKPPPPTPLLGIVEVNKPKFHKKVDIAFQLGQFKRFVYFGTETHYKSALKRSVNRWFFTEVNIRLYVGECKMKSLKYLSSAVEALSEKKEEEEDISRKEDILNRLANILIDNVNNSPVGVIPYLLSRIYSYPSLRPVLPKVFLKVIRNSFELLTFARYLKKVKGNHCCSRKLFIEWYKVHCEDNEHIRDLLLPIRRVGWKHRDVIVHWKIPVPETSCYLRMLMGYKPDPLAFPPEKVSLIVKIIALRKINDRNRWLKMVDSEEFITEIGLDLCYNIKNRLYNADVLKVVIERVPLNEVIENIPRMWQKLPWSKPLLKILVDQLQNWQKKYDQQQLEDVNILSAFIVWKWLALQEYLFYGEGKSLRDPKSIDRKYYPISVAPIMKIVGNIFENELYRRPDEILFVLNIPNADLEESGCNFSKKPNNQELKRPPMFPNVIKPVEFIQFLLFIYPNNRVVYKDKHYKISGKSYKAVGAELTKMRNQTNSTNVLPSNPVQPYKHVIYITFDGSVDLSEESPLKTHKAEKVVVLSMRSEDITQVKEKINHRNLLVIKGLDCNFLSHTEKFFNFTY